MIDIVKKQEALALYKFFKVKIQVKRKGKIEFIKDIHINLQLKLTNHDIFYIDN